MLRKVLNTALLITICFFIANCYRIPVVQGNYIAANDANKIRKGMSPAQVVDTLGNPVLNNIYKNGQMAYIYTIKKSASKRKESRMIVYFEKNKVVTVVFSGS